MDTHSLLYATNLTGAEWSLLQPLLPAEAPTGRLCIHARRTILNAIFYVLRTGCALRFLPQEWPAWQTVYGYFRRWRRDGTWELIHRMLRPSPHEDDGAWISLPSSGVGSPRARGDDAGIIAQQQARITELEGRVTALLNAPQQTPAPVPAPTLAQTPSVTPEAIARAASQAFVAAPMCAAAARRSMSASAQ